MSYTDLREFIGALEKAGEMRRVSVEVDPVLEIAEFADRSVKRGGPALLFEKPRGSEIPVLINAFASARRMELALDVSNIGEVGAGPGVDCGFEGLLDFEPSVFDALDSLFGGHLRVSWLRM